MLAENGNWRQMAAMDAAMMFHDAKAAIVDLTDFSKDTLHVYVALVVFLGSCWIFRWRPAQWKPWLLVLFLVLLGEVWDVQYSLADDDPIHIWRNGKEHIARFERGETVRHLEVVGEANGRKGTERPHPSRRRFAPPQGEGSSGRASC